MHVQRCLFLLILLITHCSLFAQQKVLIWQRTQSRAHDISNLLKSFDLTIVETVVGPQGKEKLKQISASKNASSLPPVIYVALQKNDASFVEDMMWCKKNGFTFLHPACFLLEADYPDPINRIRNYGFPGSGNILAQQFMYDNFVPSPLTPTQFLYYTLAFDYYFKLNYVINESFKDRCLTNTDYSHDFFSLNLFEGGIVVKKKSITSEEIHRAVLTGFPLLNSIWDNISGTHSFPYPEDIKFQAKKKFKQCILLRNPVDTIFACYSKQLPANYSISENEKFATFCVFAKYYSEYLRQVINVLEMPSDNDQQLLVVRYEDLIYHPLIAFQSISELLNLKISTASIEKWCQQRLFTDLPLVSHGHFKGGGEGKWKKHYSKEYYAILEENHIVDYAQKLGYYINASDFQAPSNPDLVFDENNLLSRNKFLGGFINFWGLHPEMKSFQTHKGLDIYLFEAGHLVGNIDYEALQPDSPLFTFFDAVFWGTPPKLPSKLPPLF